MEMKVKTEPPPAKIAAVTAYPDLKPMRPIRFLRGCFIAFAACFGMAIADNVEDWPHSAFIYINTSEGGKLSAPVRNFPLLVRFKGPSRIFDEARPDGADVRFLAADGTPLDRQIERWDKAELKAEIWVKVPELRFSGPNPSDSGTDVIICRWGNPSAIMPSDGSKVFPAADGFAGVWHLGEGGIQTRANSVGGGNHALPVNYTGAEGTEGVVGQADSLNGAPAGAYLDIGAGFADLSKGLTYTGWIYASAKVAWGRMFDLGNGEQIDNVAFARNDTSNGFGLMRYIGKTASPPVLNGSKFDLNVWMHIGVTVNGTDVLFYKNGVEAYRQKTVVYLNNVQRTQNFLGKSNWHADGYFKGVMDEPEISLVPRSADWIRLSYENQKQGSAMLSLVYRPDAGPVAKPDLSPWKYSQTIRMNTLLLGPNPIGGDVADFPLLLRFTKVNMDFSQAHGNGADLRFADPDGNALSFEVERWDSAAALGEVWLRLPKVAGDKDAAVARMYWGNASATSVAHPGSAFRNQDGFAGVWHFDETSDAPVDAVTGSANTSISGPVGRVPGLIANAFRFGGGATHVSIPASITRGRASFTLSLWARETVTGGSGANPAFYPTLFGMATPGQSSGDLGLVSLNGVSMFWHGLKTGGDQYSPPGHALNDGKWHHLAVVYGGMGVAIYESGKVVSLMLADEKVVGDSSFAIGSSHVNDGSFNYGFTGEIDAVQFSSVARSTDWIRLATLTQNDTANIAAFGSVSTFTVPETVTVAIPTVDPAPGSFIGALSVRLLCATSQASVWYTLDGSDPDTSKAATQRFAAPIRLERNTVIRARAYLGSSASETLAVEYQVAISNISLGDTLKPGRIVNIDANHWIDYPFQDAQSPVLIATGAVPNPAPAGFDKVGPLIAVRTSQPGALFPGLPISSTDSMAGVSLYRVDSPGRFLWMPYLDGKLWIPSPGDYFWARDTLAPAIRLVRTRAFGGDSARATFAIQDNIGNPQVLLRIRTDVQDSLGWWTAVSGDTVGFTFRFGNDPQSPAEINLSATDHSHSVIYPSGAATALTLGRSIPALHSPVTIDADLKWKLMGVPVIPDAPLSMAMLAGMSGADSLIAAVWNPDAAPDPAYEFLRAADAFPAGRGIWMASPAATVRLDFPASRSQSSDSQGFFPIRLTHGWNLVTCPSLRSLAWPASRSDGESYLQSPFKTLHGFDGTGYVVQDSLRPWEGYYVHYNGLDTIVRVGPGAGRGSIKRASGKAAASGWMEITLRNRAGPRLKIGTASFARDGIGIEDELRPPPRTGSPGTWITRAGRDLIGDYLAPNSERALSWTVVARAGVGGGGAAARTDAADQTNSEESAELAVEDAILPKGYQVWAVSRARRMKYRLAAGTALPIEGTDTLRIYAGMPRVLAGIGDLQRGLESPGPFACALRAADGGFELSVELPEAARMDVRIWSPAGRRLGGLDGALLGAGHHTWKSGALLRGAETASRGVYLLVLSAQGREWSGHRVLKTGIVR
jgi:hypothetical protein